MGFTITKKNINDNKIVFVYEDGAYPGTVKIAEKVCDDFNAVFGARPVTLSFENLKDAKSYVNQPIFFATINRSALLERLSSMGLVDLKALEGKREVYSFTVLDELKFDDFYFESAIIIAGSDKRGTIYGLFKLSQMLGVSPFTNWLSVTPGKLTKYEFKREDSFVSREPSVRFRGFFINDEWPAFGNFCEHNFGGFNAKAYEHVFELLLRLKGNYLWPAMWSAIFPDDGPGLESAYLADELGVIMGTSHHEPCCRQGEEYKYLRGADSIYGDAWNFRTNPDGITRFWEDGLKRSGKFENVITVGMRGECDTAIMGKDATLKDNIDLLRDVIRTQNRLIRENVNENLDEVPRMLALYKEVEPYFYGDENTKGLMGDEELKGVTLMLCDDNYGNLRTTPTKEMLSHKGGYGMYYHFDYHGFPISYEWFNTSYLPKVWEQMSGAYDFGIRDLWIVNVGDIFTNEYPLSFFLDLAYDFDKWGTANKNSAQMYTREFVKREFGAKVSGEDADRIYELLMGYTKITGMRRTEAMNDKVYDAFNYSETDRLLCRIKYLMKTAKDLLKKMPPDVSASFYELVYLPLTANLNVQRMWLLTSQNHAYASFGSTYALTLAKKVASCIKKDKKLVDELHSVENGKWYGMGLSEHIGFKNWCEEECRYPVVHTFTPANKPRLIVNIPGSHQHTEGGFWSGKDLEIRDFLNPAKSKASFNITTAGLSEVPFKIKVNNKYLSVSEEEGIAKAYEKKIIRVKLDRDNYVKKGLKDAGNLTKHGDLVEPDIVVSYGEANICIKVPVCVLRDELKSLPKNTFINTQGYISIEAEHYIQKTDRRGSFEIIEDYGRTLSALKAYPQNLFCDKNEGSAVKSEPIAEVKYMFWQDEPGDLVVRLYCSPSNPPTSFKEINAEINLNADKSYIVNIIPEEFAVGDGNDCWMQGVLDNIRIKEVEVTGKYGLNSLCIKTLSPCFVLQKLVIYKKGEEPAASYLGPEETYRI